MKYSHEAHFHFPTLLRNTMSLEEGYKSGRSWNLSLVLFTLLHFSVHKDFLVLQVHSYKLDSFKGSSQGKMLLATYIVDLEIHILEWLSGLSKPYCFLQGLGSLFLQYVLYQTYIS